ncbi:MAG: hypothetical protein ACM31C_09670 [Acidobacteriota bacterium]
MRTALGVLAICAVAALAVYVFQRPTIGRGDAFAAQFIDDHPTVKTMTCDDKYVIGVDGASFHCAVLMKDGDSERVSVSLDRGGTYRLFPIQSEHPEHHDVPASSDPWE